MFAARESNEVTRLWEGHLESCRSDADLLSLCLLAKSSDSRGWLERRISLDLESRRQFHQARALILTGLLDGDVGEFANMTWLDEVRDVAIRYRNANAWATKWFNLFVNAPDDDHASAAFGLMLECLDRRFWTWWKAPPERIRDLPAHRKAFLIQNIGRIKRKIRENEKAMQERFLSDRILQGQVWPWLSLHRGAPPRHDDPSFGADGK
jgi:hypothetical protein